MGICTSYPEFLKELGICSPIFPTTDGEGIRQESLVENTLPARQLGSQEPQGR